VNAAAKLTDAHVMLLRDISSQSFCTVVTTGRAHVPIFEDLVTMGLASAHRSSIGEPDERATYSITPAGRAALEAK
jgi:DNA-binding PadR family transcriptional regulator